MKKTLALFFASTALTVAIGLPALSLARTALDGTPAFAAILGDDDHAPAMILASGDDDDEGDDDEGRHAKSSRHDDDDGAECDFDGDDDEGCGGLQNNPAPAGSVAPPANGLFGNGKSPVAVTH